MTQEQMMTKLERFADTPKEGTFHQYPSDDEVEEYRKELEVQEMVRRLTDEPDTVIRQMSLADREAFIKALFNGLTVEERDNIRRDL